VRAPPPRRAKRAASGVSSRVALPRGAPLSGKKHQQRKAPKIMRNISGIIENDNIAGRTTAPGGVVWWAGGIAACGAWSCGERCSGDVCVRHRRSASRIRTASLTHIGISENDKHHRRKARRASWRSVNIDRNSTQRCCGAPLAWHGSSLSSKYWHRAHRITRRRGRDAVISPRCRCIFCKKTARWRLQATASVRKLAGRAIS